MTNRGVGIGMKITGMGAALPEKVITNEDLTAFMDTSDEWIRERTGISQRRIGGTTSGLAIEAGQKALDESGVDPLEIELLIVATTTPDYIMPATAPAVAHELGLDCGAFDVAAVCSGFAYAITVAQGYLAQGLTKILVIGADTMERITDYTDRGTGILFANGAGAAVVEADETGEGQILGWDLGANGKYVHILYSEHDDTMVMDGKEVFRQAVKVMRQSTMKTLEMAGLTVDDVDIIVPHQANVRIVESAWKKLGFSMDKTLMVLNETGNTSAASIPLCLDRGLSQDRIKTGDNVLMLGFGAGMTWASVLLRWNGITTHTAGF